MAEGVTGPRAGSSPVGGTVVRSRSATRRLAARRAREGVGRRGAVRRGDGFRLASVAERRGADRRGIGSRFGIATVAERRGADRRGTGSRLATAAERRGADRQGTGSRLAIVAGWRVGWRGGVSPLATAAGRRVGNRTREGAVPPFAAAVVGGSGAPRPAAVGRRFGAPARPPLPTRRRGRILRFGFAALSLALTGCSPEAPGAEPAGEENGAEEAAVAGGTGIAAESAARDGGSPSSLPRPELHPGMPGVLNEAEIAALGTARERALGEIAHLPEFGFGEGAGPERIAAWDIDIGPEGEGLPAGRGSVERGETLYRLQCVQCHGLRGEGADFEALAGRVPGDAFPFAEQWRYPITVGSYWPYATTLFDYIRRAMPQAAPGTLPPDDVYALTAYVLHLNDLLEPGETLDADSLPRIVMPARDRFVRDDRRGGPEVR